MYYYYNASRMIQRWRICRESKSNSGFCAISFDPSAWTNNPFSTVGLTKLQSFRSTVMAVSPNTALNQPSLSCSIKLYSGLKPQSPSFWANGYQNLSAEFYGRVHKSLQCRTGKPTRSRVKMMPIGTPRVPYRNREEGTWQWVDIWNALYRERVIFIGQNIDEEFSNQILATMLYLDTLDDSRRIYLYLNGPGGDLTPSLAIYDTMQSLRSPIGTHCVGLAYNLAGFLLAAGEKGNRFAMPLSRIALQSPAGAARGQADDIRNEANELLRIRDYLFNELAKNTGQPIERIYKDLSRVKRFDAQEAIEYGLIDKIVRPPRIKDDAPRKDESSTGLG